MIMYVRILLHLIVCIYLPDRCRASGLNDGLIRNVTAKMF